MICNTLAAKAFGLLAMSHMAFSFGTINGNGQMAEHERITRDALACAPGTTSTGDCFEPLSIDQLAGKQGSTGAVGAPDTDEFLSSVAHCDDADFIDVVKYGIAGPYAQTRAVATQALLDCVTHLSGRISEGLKAAKGLLDDKGNIIKFDTDLADGGDCTFTGGIQFGGRAKCNALEGLGRALHGAQDFYSHSNWADNANNTAISISNPPGLHLSAPANLLNLRSDEGPKTFGVPPELATGCFIVGIPPDTTGVRDCAKQGRITHATLNKDEGTINVVPQISIPPPSPLTSLPTTPRGQITNNFELAVEGAILETRRQWMDFRNSLVVSYGAKKANLMVCALTRDSPWKDCTGRKIALVIDSSGSNQDTDPTGLRITAARDFNSQLVTAASAGPDDFPDLVTVITFTTSATVLYPLGDPASATFAGVGADGGTFIAGGVSLATDQLSANQADSTQDHSSIIVFTDGEDSDTATLINEIDRAGQLGIRVFLGLLSPQPVGVIPRALQARQAGTIALPPSDLLGAILGTGGLFGVINSAAAQASFVDLVVARGATNIDSIGSYNGGQLFPGVLTVSLLKPTQSVVVFTFHATAGESLVFDTQIITGGALNVILHDVNDIEELSIVATNAQGLSRITYVVTADVDLELIVSGTGANSTQLFSVSLSGTGLPPPGSKSTTTSTSSSTLATTASSLTTSIDSSGSLTTSINSSGSLTTSINSSGSLTTSASITNSGSGLASIPSTKPYGTTKLDGTKPYGTSKPDMTSKPDTPWNPGAPQEPDVSSKPEASYKPGITTKHDMSTLSGPAGMPWSTATSGQKPTLHAVSNSAGQTAGDYKYYMVVLVAMEVFIILLLNSS
jgi:hypothetical protein